MKTLEQLLQRPSVPAHVAMLVGDLGEARGKQELFTRQSPEKLKVLKESAIVESTISSNRIEGVEIESARIGTVLFGHPALKDRDEEEIQGYRNALSLIHDKGADLPITEEVICELHRLCRGQIWDTGQYKERDGDIIERYPDGRHRIRFKPTSAADTPSAMAGLVASWVALRDERPVPALIALAAFNFDFLCIHPFRDGNGRVSRLLLLLQLYHLGFEVGRYVSLERIIEENKARYYETLEQASEGWHEGRHDHWPFTTYLLSMVNNAYRRFEQRVGEIRSPRGAKSEQVLRAIDGQVGRFRVAELKAQCPGVSLDSIRRVLKARRDAGQLECLGRGQKAQWQKTAAWELGKDDING